MSKRLIGQVFGQILQIGLLPKKFRFLKNVGRLQIKAKKSTKHFSNFSNMYGKNAKVYFITRF